MQSIPLKQIPNQRFNIPLGSNNWQISIRSTDGCVSVSVAKNGVPMFTNMRVVPGTRVIPCRYQEDGNFFFSSQNFELLDYTKFGISQFMFYATQEEVDAVRATRTGIITAADFDPNGDLPQSFAPKGYRIA